MNRIARRFRLFNQMITLVDRLPQIAGTAALALLLLGATGCNGSDPLSSDPANTQNNGGQQNSGGAQGGGVNSFLVNGDSYANARFSSTAHMAQVYYGSTNIYLTGVHNGKPATLSISLQGTSPGTYQIGAGGLNVITMSINDGFKRDYGTSGGFVTITDMGSNSGILKGSFTGTVLRYETGAEVAVSGTFAASRK